MLDLDYLSAFRFDPIRTTVTDRDSMLYALTIGLGRDPLDPHDLRFVYEKDLQVFPTMPVVIGHPGAWMTDPRTGITRAMVVHGAQRLWMHRPLVVGAEVISQNRIIEIVDKGDRGAILSIARTTTDAEGALIARGESLVFCRADGGFGGSSQSTYEFQPPPDRAPDRLVDIPTQPNLALLYRLNQDRNPLHADPAAAAKAGFPRPILHGLATWGLAAAAVAQAWPDRTLARFEARFSKPVTPGDTITLDLWDEGDEVAFRARVAERGETVLDFGRAGWG